LAGAIKIKKHKYLTNFVFPKTIMKEVIIGYVSGYIFSIEKKV
jgi:ABC-type iron transport system FetAB permease component